MIAFTLGELIGFGGIPVLGGMLALHLASDLDAATKALALYGVAIVGGLGEGAVLGWFQQRVLRMRLPRLDAVRWVAVTGLAAAFAWACGMLAPTLDDLYGLSAAGQVVIWIPAGLLILLSIGTAQAWVLRGLVDEPRRWILGNVLGWLAGLPWTFILPALVPEGAPPGVWIATFVLSGLLMGATAGAITGGFLLRLVPVSLGNREVG